MLENPSSTETPDIDLELAEVTGQSEKAVTQETNDTPKVPDKYAGKTLDDVIAMHQNAERKISQQGNDLAELKRASAVLIQNKKDNVEQVKERKPVTVDALLDNPDKVLADTLQASPIKRQADEAVERVNQLESKLAYGDFARSYPDYRKDIKNPEFIEWINRNGTRLGLANAADKGNATAALALWDMWAEYSELVGGNADKGKARGADATKRAATVKAAPQEQRAKPTYSRAKLDALRYRAMDGDPVAQAKLNDPEFNARLIEAYAEKRVK